MGLVRIRGLGPAGAALANLLGQRAVALDVARRYVKACGEAVRVEMPLVERKHVKSRVRRFDFYYGDRHIGTVEYRAPRWYIIDKSAWVNGLREGACVGCEADDVEVEVDARGPHGNGQAKVITVRAYVVGAKLPDDTVSFHFAEGMTGFYWVFPYGDGTANVGAGFLGVRNPIPHLERFVSARFPGARMTDVRGAPITVGGRTNLVEDGTVKVGEAAGLVYPLTGEGIGLAVASALALTRAMSSRRPLDTYRRLMAPYVGQVRLQGMLLRAAARAANVGRSIEEAGTGDLLYRYVEEDLSARLLLAVLAKRPRLLFGLLRGLLRR